MTINIERLIEKINAKPNWYKMNGKVIDDEQYIKNLNTLCE